MDNGDKFLIVFFVFATGFIIGILSADAINHPVTMEAKHEVCKELYGEDYYFVDTEFGLELQFTCQKDEIVIEKVEEEKPLVVKLN